jgi:hypothetical protein
MPCYKACCTYARMHERFAAVSRVVCAEELLLPDQPAPEVVQDVDASALERVRSAITTLTCQAFSPYAHTSGAPAKLKARLCSPFLCDPEEGPCLRGHDHVHAGPHEPAEWHPRRSSARRACRSGWPAPLAGRGQVERRRQRSLLQARMRGPTRLHTLGMPCVGPWASQQRTQGCSRVTTGGR